MSEEHAVPPSPEEHHRKVARLKAFTGYAFFALIGILWLLIEFGGEWVQEALATLVLIGFGIWVITWPVRKWRDWQRGRRRKGRVA